MLRCSESCTDAARVAPCYPYKHKIDFDGEPTRAP